MKAILIGLIIFTALLHGVFPAPSAFLIGALMWFGFSIVAIIREIANDERLISWETVDD